ncbi:leucine-rich repeat transmembrane protein CCDC168 [Sorex araneus]|uniref:leucine-rich repeat transmembrane protein CCDC168 n=1 Tax=Sorex araneus TaxID=42254 RepID=UPI0024334C48|nr:leucine-rich repeat transmembrane protein CCDC168 [Sorex araneus]
MSSQYFLKSILDVLKDNGFLAAWEFLQSEVFQNNWFAIVFIIYLGIVLEMVFIKICTSLQRKLALSEERTSDSRERSNSSQSMIHSEVKKIFLSHQDHPEKEQEPVQFSSNKLFSIMKTKNPNTLMYSSNYRWTKTSTVSQESETPEVAPCPLAHLFLTRDQISLLEENVRNQISFKSKVTFEGKISFLLPKSQESLIQKQHSVQVDTVIQAQNSFLGHKTIKNQHFYEAKLTSQGQQFASNQGSISSQHDTKATCLVLPQDVKKNPFCSSMQESTQAKDVDRSLHLTDTSCSVEFQDLIKILESNEHLNEAQSSIWFQDSNKIKESTQNQATRYKNAKHLVSAVLPYLVVKETPQLKSIKKKDQPQIASSKLRQDSPSDSLPLFPIIKKHKRKALSSTALYLISRPVLPYVKEYSKRNLVKVVLGLMVCKAFFLKRNESSDVEKQSIEKRGVSEFCASSSKTTSGQQDLEYEIFFNGTTSRLMQKLISSFKMESNRRLKTMKVLKSSENSHLLVSNGEKITTSKPDMERSFPKGNIQKDFMKTALKSIDINLSFSLGTQKHGNSEQLLCGYSRDGYVKECIETPRGRKSADPKNPVAMLENIPIDEVSSGTTECGPPLGGDPRKIAGVAREKEVLSKALSKIVVGSFINHLLTSPNLRRQEIQKKLPGRQRVFRPKYVTMKSKEPEISLIPDNHRHGTPSHRERLRGDKNILEQMPQYKKTDRLLNVIYPHKSSLPHIHIHSTLNPKTLSHMDPNQEKSLVDKEGKCSDSINIRSNSKSSLAAKLQDGVRGDEEADPTEVLQKSLNLKVNLDLKKELKTEKELPQPTPSAEILTRPVCSYPTDSVEVENVQGRLMAEYKFKDSVETKDYCVPALHCSKTITKKVRFLLTECPKGAKTVEEKPTHLPEFSAQAGKNSELNLKTGMEDRKQVEENKTLPTLDNCQGFLFDVYQKDRDLLELHEDSRQPQSASIAVEPQTHLTQTILHSVSCPTNSTELQKRSSSTMEINGQEKKEEENTPKLSSTPHNAQHFKSGVLCGTNPAPCKLESELSSSEGRKTWDVSCLVERVKREESIRKTILKSVSRYLTDFSQVERMGKHLHPQKGREAVASLKTPFRGERKPKTQSVHKIPEDGDSRRKFDCDSFEKETWIKSELRTVLKSSDFSNFHLSKPRSQGYSLEFRDKESMIPKHISLKVEKTLSASQLPNITRYLTGSHSKAKRQTKKCARKASLCATEREEISPSRLVSDKLPSHMTAGDTQCMRTLHKTSDNHLTGEKAELGENSTTAFLEPLDCYRPVLSDSESQVSGNKVMLDPIRLTIKKKEPSLSHVLNGKFASKHRKNRESHLETSMKVMKIVKDVVDPIMKSICSALDVVDTAVQSKLHIEEKNNIRQRLNQDIICSRRKTLKLEGTELLHPFHYTDHGTQNHRLDLQWSITGETANMEHRKVKPDFIGANVHNFIHSSPRLKLNQETVDEIISNNERETQKPLLLKKKDRVRESNVGGVKNIKAILRTGKLSVSPHNGKHLPMILNTIKQEGTRQGGEDPSGVKPTNMCPFLPFLSYSNLNSRLAEGENSGIPKICLPPLIFQAFGSTRPTSSVESTNIGDLGNGVKSRRYFPHRKMENVPKMNDIMGLKCIAFKGKRTHFKHLLFGKEPQWNNIEEKKLTQKDKHNLDKPHTYISSSYMDRDAGIKVHVQGKMRSSYPIITLQDVLTTKGICEEPTNNIARKMKKEEHVSQKDEGMVEKTLEEIGSLDRIAKKETMSPITQRLELIKEEDKKIQKNPNKVEVMEETCASTSFPHYSEVNRRTNDEKVIAEQEKKKEKLKSEASMVLSNSTFIPALSHVESYTQTKKSDFLIARQYKPQNGEDRGEDRVAMSYLIKPGHCVGHEKAKERVKTEGEEERLCTQVLTWRAESCPLGHLPSKTISSLNDRQELGKSDNKVCTKSLIDWRLIHKMNKAEKMPHKYMDPKAKKSSHAQRLNSRKLQWKIKELERMVWENKNDLVVGLKNVRTTLVTLPHVELDNSEEGGYMIRITKYLQPPHLRTAELSDVAKIAHFAIIGQEPCSSLKEFKEPTLQKCNEAREENVAMNTMGAQGLALGEPGERKEPGHLLSSKHQEEKIRESGEEAGEVLTESPLSALSISTLELGNNRQGDGMLVHTKTAMQRTSSVKERTPTEPVSPSSLKDVPTEEEQKAQGRRSSQEGIVEERGKMLFAPMAGKSRTWQCPSVRHRTEMHLDIGGREQRRREDENQSRSKMQRKIYVSQAPLKNLHLDKGTQVDVGMLGVQRPPVQPIVLLTLSNREKTQGAEAKDGGGRKNEPCKFQKEEKHEVNLRVKMQPNFPRGSPISQILDSKEFVLNIIEQNNNVLGDDPCVVLTRTLISTPTEPTFYLDPGNRTDGEVPAKTRACPSRLLFSSIKKMPLEICITCGTPASTKNFSVLGDEPRDPGSKVPPGSAKSCKRDETKKDVQSYYQKNKMLHPWTEGSHEKTSITGLNIPPNMDYQERRKEPKAPDSRQNTQLQKPSTKRDFVNYSQYPTIPRSPKCDDWEGRSTIAHRKRELTPQCLTMKIRNHPILQLLGNVEQLEFESIGPQEITLWDENGAEMYLGNLYLSRVLVPQAEEATAAERHQERGKESCSLEPQKSQGISQTMWSVWSTGDHKLLNTLPRDSQALGVQPQEERNGPSVTPRADGSRWQGEVLPALHTEDKAVLGHGASRLYEDPNPPVLQPEAAAKATPAPTTSTSEARSQAQSISERFTPEGERTLQRHLECKTREICLSPIPERVAQSRQQHASGSKEEVASPGIQGGSAPPHPKVCCLSVDGTDTVELNLTRQGPGGAAEGSPLKSLIIHFSDRSSRGLGWPGATQRGSGARALAASAVESSWPPVLQLCPMEHRDKLLVHFARRTLEFQVRSLPRMVRASHRAARAQERKPAAWSCLSRPEARGPPGPPDRAVLLFDEKSLRQIDLDLQYKYFRFLLGLHGTRSVLKPQALPGYSDNVHRQQAPGGGLPPAGGERAEKPFSFKNPRLQSSLWIRKSLKSLLGAASAPGGSRRERRDATGLPADKHRHGHVWFQEAAPSLHPRPQKNVVDVIKFPSALPPDAFPGPKTGLSKSGQSLSPAGQSSEETVVLEANSYLGEESESILHEVQTGTPLEKARIKKIKMDLKSLDRDTLGPGQIWVCERHSLAIAPPHPESHCGRRHRAPSQRHPSGRAPELSLVPREPSRKSPLSCPKEKGARTTRNKTTCSLVPLTESNLKLHLARSQGRPPWGYESRDRKKAKADLLRKHHGHQDRGHGHPRSPGERRRKKAGVCCEPGAPHHASSRTKPARKPCPRAAPSCCEGSRHLPFVYACIPADSLQVIPQTVRWAIPLHTLRKNNFRAPMVAKISRTLGAPRECAGVTLGPLSCASPTLTFAYPQ